VSTDSAAPATSVLGTGRGLDHVLIVVRNLEEAARSYADMLGFSVRPGGSFPDGVRNSVVFLGGNYLELLSVDRTKVAPDHELARLLEKREGGYAFALNVSSARQTAGFLRARKFDVTDPQGSSYTPEGSKDVQTALWQTVAIKEPSLEFQPLFFIQYARESTRKVPEHPNTAVRVHAVWIAVKDLEAAVRAYETLGLRAVGNVRVPALAATGRQIEAGQGMIVLLQAKEASGPLASQVSQHGEGVVGVSIEVRDLDAARSRIQASTKRPLESYSGAFGQSVLVPPEFTHGMWIEFFAKTGG
jgi:catechol 2,3-dioxygenase-like lactoylglutathione lyase family enzyme